jgi:lipopolysaccharide export system permease protein
VNLIAAILIYVAYNNASGLFKAWASQGKVSFMVGLMATHLIVLALAAFLFWRRTSLLRLWPWGSVTQGDRRNTASSDVASS